MREFCLGLDGSLKNFGIAVASYDKDNLGDIKIHDLILSKTEPSKVKGIRRSDDDIARFRQHASLIKDAISRYGVSVAYGEVPHGAKDSRAMYAFGGVVGIYASLDIPFVSVTALEVKHAATGAKHADKEDVIESMYSQFPYATWLTSKRTNKMELKTLSGENLSPDNEHLADAAAAVLAGIKK